MCHLTTSDLKHQRNVAVRHVGVLWPSFKSPVLPQLGTSSSADDVCSSMEGFFLPSPMILVIFLPAPFPTVPVLCSDFEFFFAFPVKQNNRLNERRGNRSSSAVPLFAVVLVIIGGKSQRDAVRSSMWIQLCMDTSAVM